MAEHTKITRYTNVCLHVSYRLAVRCKKSDGQTLKIMGFKMFYILVDLHVKYLNFINRLKSDGGTKTFFCKMYSIFSYRLASEMTDFHQMIKV